MRSDHEGSKGAHRMGLSGLALGIVALVLATWLAMAPPARAQMGSSYVQPEVSQVTFTTATVREGQTFTGRVFMNVPTFSSVEVSLTSSHADVEVNPATLIVPSGTLMGAHREFTIRVKENPAGGSAIIKATRVGSSVVKETTLQVSPIAVASVTITPATLQPGQTSTGTVTLDGPAPSTNLRVDLSSSRPADVPVSNFVVVGAAGRIATFDVKAEENAATGTVDVFAARSGSATAVKATATVALAQVASVRLSPREIFQGHDSTGTVTLDMKAAPGGVKVEVESGGAHVTVPAEITVAADSDSATFTATATSSGVGGPATIRAWRSGATQKKSSFVTVKPIGVKSVTVNPTTVAPGGDTTGTVTLDWAAGAGGVKVALVGAGLTMPAEVIVPAGSDTATFSATVTGSGSSRTVHANRGRTSQTATLSVTSNEVKALTLNPASVAEGGSTTGTVTLDGPAGAGGMTVKLDGADLTMPAEVAVAAGSDTATFAATVTGAGSSRIVRAQRSGATVWKTATLAITPNEVKALTLSPTSVAEGRTVTGTVTLDAPAGGSGATVALRSVGVGANIAEVTVPAEVSVAAGRTSATFTATARAAGTATLGAKRSGSTAEKTAALTVTAAVAAPRVRSLTFSSAEIKPGASVTATVTLDAAAPAPNFRVVLRSASTVLTVPASATVSPGATTATFTVSAAASAPAGSATIEADGGGSSGKATATLTIKK